MVDDPLVSAIIPTYNRPERVARAVMSVIEQRYDPIELVVVDDHSDRPTSDVIADLPTDELAGLRVVRHEENRGGGAARNTGIDAASGDFLAFLDDDDRWRPEKTALQIEAFRAADRSVGVVYVGRRVIDEGGETDDIPETPDEDFTKALLCENVVGSTSVVMTRRKCVEAAGGFDERFPSWQELEWYVRLSRHCGFQLVDRPLVRYDTTGGDRITDDFGKVERGYELFVDKHERLAGEYGPLFRRKMLAWAAFRAGENALANGLVRVSRRYVARALRLYPFERRFAMYFLALLGGPSTYRMATSIRDALTSNPRG